MYNFKLLHRITLDPRLSYSEKMIAAFLYSRKNLTGKYRLSLAQLAKKISCCTTTVSKAIERLSELQYIDKIRNYLYDGSLSRVVWDKHSYVTKLETNRDFTFIPANIFTYHLSFSAFVLYCYLRYKAGNMDKAFPSYSLIYKELGMSKSTVQRGAKMLEAAGLIYVEHYKKNRGDFASNTYHFTECKAPESEGEASGNIKVDQAVPFVTQEVIGQNVRIDVKHVLKRSSVDAFIKLQRTGYLIKKSIKLNINSHKLRQLCNLPHIAAFQDTARLLL